jgi:hypothetical protein
MLKNIGELESVEIGAVGIAICIGALALDIDWFKNPPSQVIT